MSRNAGGTVSAGIRSGATRHRPVRGAFDRATSLHDAALQCLTNAEIAINPELKLRWALRGIELFAAAAAVRTARARG